MEINSEIEAKIEKLRQRVEKAARRAGRSKEDIKIVAVTKTVDPDRIKAVIKTGISDFGENYVQEAREKISILGKNIKWHFIGHLQKNKVNAAIELFDLIQSVDSIELAEKLEKRCAQENKTIDILLQIHYGDEETKFGFLPQEIKFALEKIGELKHIRVKGLMTIPPFVVDPEENRKYFKDMYNLANSLSSCGFPNWENKYISMGMTDDFEIAIEEGSNMIRVGRAIFGERTRK